MNILDWAGLAVAVSTLLGSLSVGVRHLVKHYLAELKPNGGSSIKDKVSEIDKKVDKLEVRIDEIYKLMVSK